MVSLLQCLQRAQDALLCGFLALADDGRDLRDAEARGEAQRQQLARVRCEVPQKYAQSRHVVAVQGTCFQVEVGVWVQSLGHRVPGQGRAPATVVVDGGVAGDAKEPGREWHPALPIARQRDRKSTRL